MTAVSIISVIHVPTIKLWFHHNALVLMTLSVSASALIASKLYYLHQSLS
jgi:hypothetical protein